MAELFLIRLALGIVHVTIEMVLLMLLLPMYKLLKPNIMDQIGGFVYLIILNVKREILQSFYNNQTPQGTIPGEFAFF